MGYSRRHGYKFWLGYNLLTLLAILSINIYVIGLPFWPAMTYATGQNIPFDDSSQAVVGAPEDIKATQQSDGNVYRGSTGTIQRIVIPKIRVNNRIYEGPDAKTLNKGIWRRPNTVSPDTGGNMVLAGHRITYSGFRAFYHLDKLVEGDDIRIDWNGTTYTYRVSKVYITDPNDISVEKPSIEQILTLYTCTPIPALTQRLVVIATAVN